MKFLIFLFALIYGSIATIDEDKAAELKEYLLKLGANLCDPAEKENAMVCYNKMPQQGHDFLKKALVDGTKLPETTSLDDLLVGYCARRTEINDELAIKYTEEWVNLSEEKQKEIIAEAMKPENHKKYMEVKECVDGLKDPA